MILIKKEIINSFSFYNISNILKVYRSSFYLGLTALIVIFYSRLDSFVLSYFSSEYMSDYASVFRLVDPLSMVFSVVATVLYAYLARKDIGKKKLLYLCIVMLSVLCCSGVVYWFALKMMMPQLISVTQENFFFIDEISKILVIVAVIKCINSLLTALIYAKGMYQFSLLSAVFSLSLAVVCLPVFILSLGSSGAGIALIVIEFSSFLLLAGFLLYNFKNYQG